MSGFGLKRVSVTCWLVTAVTLCVPVVAWSCQVPVFRYALEHWDPDRYLAVVIHDGSLKPTDDALVDRLNDVAASDESPVNLATRTVAFEELLDDVVPEHVGAQPDRLGTGIDILMEGQRYLLINSPDLSATQ